MEIEFINLDDPITLPNYPHSVSNIMPDTKLIGGIMEDIEVEGISTIYGVTTITKLPDISSEATEEEQLCIKEGCDASNYYGCTNEKGGFQKDNLFSELTDEYQRTQARINLGITDEYAMVWGNIKGNLPNQKDLYTFVVDSIAYDINRIVDEINVKLAQWAYEIEIRFKNKADILSPNFAGKPTTTLPLITDNSNRIASTEWVNAKIAAASIDENVKAISLEPEYMCYGDPPTDVTIIWDYYKDVESQSINDVTIPNNIREYIFSGQTTSMVITLKYSYEGVNETKILTFDIKYPIYYGTSTDYTKLKTTISNSFTVTAKVGEYMYIMIPNGKDALLAVSSIIGGFKLFGTQEIFGNLYYVFKSAHSGLGDSVVEIMSQGDFDTGGFDIDTIKELLISKADKYDVYNKSAIDQMFDKFATSEGNLKNYYTKSEVDSKIPNISNKADRSEIPTKVSELDNDENYISAIPEEYITETRLSQKGFLTQELEPAFTASVASKITTSNIANWNNKVDKIEGKGLSSNDFTLVEKIKLGNMVEYDDTIIKQNIKTLAEEVTTKANKSEIPDISNKANRSEIPTRVSQLTNDNNYLTSLPEGLVTEEILQSKGFLTSFIEEDPTVPAWAKEPNKPTYTADDVGAEVKGASNNALSEARKYINEQVTGLLGGADSSYATFKDTQTAIEQINKVLPNKANITDLFSKKYSDLSGTPIIPSIEGLATEKYVNASIATIPKVDLSEYAKRNEIPDISNKVDKVLGKELSTNDFTNTYKTKLESLYNYDDASIKQSLSRLLDFQLFLDSSVIFIPKDLYNSFDLLTFDVAKEHIDRILKSKLVVINHITYESLVCFKKVGTQITDADEVTFTDVTLMFHYDSTQDLKVVFSYRSDGSFTFVKTFIPIVNIEALITRLDTLETAIDRIVTRESIILE